MQTLIHTTFFSQSLLPNVHKIPSILRLVERKRSGLFDSPPTLVSASLIISLSFVHIKASIDILPPHVAIEQCVWEESIGLEFPMEGVLKREVVFAKIVVLGFAMKSQDNIWSQIISYVHDAFWNVKTQSIKSQTAF